MTSEGLGEMFEGDSADTCGQKFPLVSMGGRAEGLACVDPEARSPIGASRNLIHFCWFLILSQLFTFYFQIVHYDHTFQGFAKLTQGGGKKEDKEDCYYLPETHKGKGSKILKYWQNY